MRLSEAIMLGSLETQQAFYKFVDEAGKRCALGAAMKATGIEMEYSQSLLTLYENGLQAFEHLSLVFPLLHQKVGEAECGCPNSGTTLRFRIMHLNDCHHVSRQVIAKWVATLEEATPSTTHMEDAPCCESHMGQSETQYAGVTGG